MSKIIQQAKQFLRDEAGVTAIEYGLLASLVGVALIAGATLLGTNLNSLFSSIGTKLG